MKKLALALTVASFAAGAACADINTGFYLGAGIGGNNTTYKADGIGVDIGRHGIQGSIYAGYGFVTGCTYLGAELGYTFTGTKAQALLFALERRNVINAALLVGQKFTPSTMAFISLGVNNAQFKITNLATEISESKRKFSFAPGLGLETAATKNIRIRLQYTYDFGPKVDGIKARTQTAMLGVAYKF